MSHPRWFSWGFVNDAQRRPWFSEDHGRFPFKQTAETPDGKQAQHRAADRNLWVEDNCARRASLSDFASRSI